ncbi:hypothetical protein LSAT2_030110 [Lamellibrachia satsuma]|nr:hypothetical protein LSAT2_006912 [Lamellibrachia satsuma]KAI0215472.1 hypothetical protein LSAT2_032478 [Lamellibrachia satsuma]KAI0225564.1 hypothetical protein LSAT2_023701 [Lamellibrachia satsuma]KAI0233975.1 hypothetical protein LSAT2_015788 [Lamellibrachia satsuma]KAI0241286.1 hypothetical protein LSAT2_030110 [Lamellibrachia satsuma]
MTYSKMADSSSSRARVPRQERSCHHRLTAEDILELMDNSDIDLSDDETNLAEMERDGYDSNLDSSDDDTVLYSDYAPSDEEAVVPTPRKRRTIWRKTATFDPAVVPAPLRHDYSGDRQAWSPADYFGMYLNDATYAEMSDMTGRHYMQATGRNIQTSSTEMKQFIGMSIMMGCLSMKRIRSYWQRATRIPVIANCMPRDRYSKLRNHFTVVDNLDVTNEQMAADRLWKVRPFVDRIQRVCVGLPRETNVSIDEQMISFTGRCPSRQYVPRKPSPTGLKNFVLAGASGLVLDFELYQGAGTFDQYELDGKKAGQGTGAVLRLTETLTNGHHLFCDRFFTTLPLICHLLEKQIYMTGTITKRKLPVPFTADVAMSKKGRGTYEQYVSGNSAVSLVKWFDNKSILMASSIYGVEPEDDCRRWSKKDRAHVQVRRPNVITQYNKNMGGVDLCDRMISYHRMEARTKRWNLRVISHFIDMVLSNCWIEHRIDSQSTMQLYDFRSTVALALMNAEPESSCDSDTSSEAEQGQRRRVSALPDLASRVQAAKHLAVAYDLKNSARCRLENCKGKTRIKCDKCNVFLCLTSARNCFRDFHSK